jgi:putative ATPase
MARILEGGEDPLFIARRMVVLASEDIGNATPNALVLAEQPLVRLIKSGCRKADNSSASAAYLASCPKSNASYKAIDDAWSDVKELPLYPVPIHYGTLLQI